jgi:hypothetical protein
MNATGTMKFQANVPVEVALQYPAGKPVESRFSGRDEVMFTLTNGQRMYLDPFVARKIEGLGIGRGEAFTLCKKVTGSGAKRNVEWLVTRGVTSPDEAPPVEWEYGLAPAQVNPAARNGRTESKLEFAMVSAIAAVAAVERYAAGVGYSVRFSTADLRTVALSVLLSAEEGLRS